MAEAFRPRGDAPSYFRGVRWRRPFAPRGTHRLSSATCSREGFSPHGGRGVLLPSRAAAKAFRPTGDVTSQLRVAQQRPPFSPCPPWAIPKALHMAHKPASAASRCRTAAPGEGERRAEPGAREPRGSLKERREGGMTTDQGRQAPPSARRPPVPANKHDEHADLQKTVPTTETLTERSEARREERLGARTPRSPHKTPPPSNPDPSHGHLSQEDTSAWNPRVPPQIVAWVVGLPVGARNCANIRRRTLGTVGALPLGAVGPGGPRTKEVQPCGVQPSLR